jgi:CheY-like chemotaxis protein
LSNLSLQVDSNVKSNEELDLLWKGKTILIAEDEENNFKYLEAILKKTEVTIIRAKDGVQAIEELKNNRIDIILMDIKMPLMDGIEATKLIRKFNKDVPIIAQTAYVLDNDEKQTIAAGCSGYISKPIKRNYLLSMLNRYFNRR